MLSFEEERGRRIMVFLKIKPACYNMSAQVHTGKKRNI